MGASFLDSLSTSGPWPWLARHPRATRIGLNLSILAALAALVSLVGMDFLGERWQAEAYLLTPKVTVATPAPSSQSSKQHGLDRYAPIAARNLFGTIREKEAVPEPEQILSKMPLASLNLELLGTVVGTDEALNTAIILDKTSRTEDLYRVGDRVKEAEVRRILRTNVVLRTGDRDVVLSMDPEQLAKSQASRPDEGASGKVMILERARIEESLNNLPALMRDARIVPYMEAGQLAGYRLSNIRPGSVYQQLGLVNNDVVMSVNDRTLTGPDQLVSLYEEMTTSGGGGVDLRVRRGTQYETLRYEIQ